MWKNFWNSCKKLIESLSIMAGAVILLCCCSARKNYNDIDEDDWSSLSGISLQYRTADSFEGEMDGVYYMVRVDRRKDTIEFGYKLYPPSDSSLYRKLSREEQWEDEISRYVALDKNEIVKIDKMMKTIEKLDAEYICVDEDGRLSNLRRNP